jgi:hypothetical protein
MAFTIPEIEPLKVTAGDRLQWKRTDLSDFPADEWTLTYYCRANVASGSFEITAAADGDNFEVDVSPATSAEYIPSIYYWSAFVTAITGSDRKLVAQGRLEIVINPSDVTGPVDGRSHNRRTLDSINAVIENRATHDQQRYVFQAVGRSVDKMPIADVLKFKDYYQTLVNQEEQAERVARGEASGRNVLVRFNL